MELFLAVVCHKITQTIYFILVMFRTSQNVLNLGWFSRICFSFSVIIATQARRSTSSICVVQITASLRNAVASCVLAIVCAVVVRLVDSRPCVRKEIVYFLRIVYSCSAVPTNWPHWKLINWLSLCTTSFMLVNRLC